MNLRGKIPLPGSFNLISLELVSDFYPALGLQLGEIVSEINLYESIFDDSISGNIILSDSRNILAKLPVVGYETLKITYSSDWEFSGPTVVNDTRSEKVATEYRVHSITNYSKDLSTSATYIINFMTKEHFKNLTTKISKGYKSTSISNIANLVYSELGSDKKLNFDETILPHDLVIPNWRPFKTLNWLASRAKSGTHGGANYQFFENNNGYNFVSLESLFAKTNDPAYIVDSYIQNPRDQVLEPGERTASFKDILDIAYDDNINISDNITTGMYASKVIEHDIVKRKFEIRDFNYRESYFLSGHINKGNTGLDHSKSSFASDGSYTNKYDARINYIPKHYKKHDNFYSYGENTEETLQIRNSQLAQLDNFRITFTVSGDNTKTVGDIIDLRIVSPEPMQSSPRVIWDPIYSGKYIITAVKHTIDPEKFVTNMTVVKDSFKDPITDSTLRVGE